jgi:hypothetical protein
MTQPHVRTTLEGSKCFNFGSQIDGDTLYGVTIYELLPWNISWHDGTHETRPPSRELKKLGRIRPIRTTGH